MADPRHFIFNSNYPIDKIIFLDERTVTPDQYGTFDVTFNHNLGAVPFCKAVATTDNWQTTYSSGTAQNEGQSYSKLFNVSSNGTNIKLSGVLIQGSTTPVKIRTWGVFNEADTLNVNVSPTSNTSSNKFILNTKYNYQSLVKEGYADARNANVTVAHNLGFLPFVDVWIQDADGRWQSFPIPPGSCFVTIPIDPNLPTINYTPQVKVDTMNVTFNKDQLNNCGRYYYRIYAHEAV